MEKSHADDNSGKANRTLSFLQRNISDCPESIKELSYKTLQLHPPALQYIITLDVPLPHLKLVAVPIHGRKVSGRPAPF